MRKRFVDMPAVAAPVKPQGVWVPNFSKG
jgi:hypothetical protein